MDTSRAESDSDTSGPSPKRAQGGTGNTIQANSKVDTVEAGDTSLRTSIVRNERRPAAKSSLKEPGTEIKPVIAVLPQATDTGIEGQSPKTVSSQKRTRVQPTPRKRPEEKQKARPDLPNRPQPSRQETSPQSLGGAHLGKQQALLHQDQHEMSSKTALHPREHTDTATKESVRKRDHVNTSSPGSKSDGGDNNQRKFANRREATMAFMMHVQTFARDFSTSPPRSERQFIWNFLEGIPDPAWAEFMQRKLLDAYPGSVRPSLGIRAKHSINFDSGLTWRHVLELIRSLQQKPGAST